MTPEEEFKRYRRLAWSIAHKMARKHHRRHEEMVDCAEYALALALWGREWDPSLGKRTTFLYTQVHYHLLNVVVYGLHPCPLSPTTSLKVVVKEGRPGVDPRPLETDPPDRSWLRSVLSELSEEGRALVGIVMETPSELADELSLRAPVKSAKRIKRFLIESWGWRPERVETVWEEVRACLQEA